MKRQYVYGIIAFALMLGAMVLIHYSGEKRFWIGASIISVASGLTIFFIYNNNRKKFSTLEKSVSDTVKKQTS